MDYINCNKHLKKLTKIIDSSVSLLMLLGISGIILFIGAQIHALFIHLLELNTSGVLHSVALLLILVKAYRLLLFYMQTHHVSIRYIIEISIIAPTVELIFAPTGRDLWMNILYAVFAITNAIIYVTYYKHLSDIDDEELHDEDELA